MIKDIIEERKKEEEEREEAHTVANKFEFLVITFRGMHSLHKEAKNAKTLKEMKEILKEITFGLREICGFLMMEYIEMEDKDDRKRKYFT